jgi:hypothetical protein
MLRYVKLMLYKKRLGGILDVVNVSGEQFITSIK